MSFPGGKSGTLYLRLLGYVKPYWKFFVGALLAMTVSAATEPLLPALMKPLLDGDFSSKHGYSVWAVPLGIVGGMLLRSSFGFIADYGLSWVSNKVVLDLRNAMFDKMVRMPTSYFDEKSAGALMSKIAYDVAGVTGAATGVITTLVKDSIAVVGLIGWMLYLNWQLTLIVFCMIPPIGFAVKSFSGRLRRVSRGGQTAMGSIMHVLEETIGAHKVVKIFGGQVYEKQRFVAANELQRGFNMRGTVAAAALGPLVQMIAATALAVIVAIALKQTENNTTTIGGFVSFITAMMMLMAPIKRLTDVNAPLQRGLAAAESVFELIDAIPEPDSGTQHLDSSRGELRIENLSFAYPAASRNAISDFSLHVTPGQTIALVGASGSGKTTLANLIPRFYSATTGRILIDGHDINHVTLSSLRDQIALVSQDVVLFNDSIAANIAYGSLKKYSRAEVRAAAESAHAVEFIDQLPDGFDTLIGENGAKLSGGQRQRLAIARAILKNAPILILDEATSALDNESERAVQAALESLMKDRTTIVIAHRLSTIENADLIVVMGRGKIIEQGRHLDLLAKEAAYAALYQSQLVTGEPL